MVDFIVVGVIVLILGFGIYRSVKKAKRGESGCCGCSGCPSSSLCGKEENANPTL